MKMMKWYAWTKAIFAAFGGFLFGYDAGAINGVKDMRAFRETFNFDSHRDNDSTLCSNSVGEGAILGLIVSTLSLGCLVGALMSGVLSDVAGRKPAIITGAVAVVVGGALQTGAYHLWMIYTGRVIAGIGIGIIYAVVPVYIAELAPRELRGRLVSFFGIFITAGVLVAVSVNFVMSEFDFGWRISLGLQCVAGTTLSLGMLFSPETPRWLVKKHKHLKATDILARIYQGDQERAEAEVADIQAVLRSGDGIPGSPSGPLHKLKVFFTWRFLHRILIGTCLLLFNRVAGLPMISYYSVSIFCQLGVSAHLGSSLFGLVYFLTTILTTFLVDRTGRKPLLLLGALKMFGIALLAATLVLVFRVEDRENRAVGYVVVVLILLFVFSYAYTFMSVPWIVNSEMHPLRIRGSITTVVYWLGNTLVAQLSPVLLASPQIRTQGTLYILAGVNITAFLFVLLVLPETKGVSLEHLDALFSKPWLQRTQVFYYLRCGSCCNSCRWPRQRLGRYDHQLHHGDSLELVSEASIDDKDSDTVVTEDVHDQTHVTEL